MWAFLPRWLDYTPGLVKRVEQLEINQQNIERQVAGLQSLWERDLRAINEHLGAIQNEMLADRTLREKRVTLDTDAMMNGFEEMAIKLVDKALEAAKGKNE